MEREELDAILKRIKNLGELAADRLGIIRRKDAELATLRAENERMRSIIQRAKVQVPSSVWTWHEDANEAMK